jgi:cysteine desulfuration protein SufE
MRAYLRYQGWSKERAMANAAFEELVEDFEFLEDWEDRYRHVIDQGKAMDALEEALRVPATKVEGCASQVWLHASVTDGRMHFDGASDAMIVSGLIAVLRTLFNGLTPEEVLAVDARAELGRLGLNDHLSAQRSNGLRAMIERVRETAAAV